MKTLKKIVAGASAIALLAMNAAYAATIGTTTNDGGTSTGAVNSTWDGTSNPATTTASGSSNVLVSAQVSPTLSMIISTGAINFGTLAPTVVQTGTLSIQTSTNAEGGVVVAMDALGLASTTKSIGGLQKGGTALTDDNTDFYSFSSNGAGATAAGNITASQNILSVGTATAANTITTVSVAAMAGPQTEAGNYSDTLTFTVSGTF